MPRHVALRIQSDNLFRFWVSLFAFLVSILLATDSPSSHFLSIVLVFMGYTGFYGLAHYAIKTSNPSSVMHYALLAVDCVAVTSLIDATGGIRSPMHILYLVIFGVCLYRNDLPSFVFSAVFSFFIYGSLLTTRIMIDHSTPLAILGQMTLMGGLIAALYVLLLLNQRENVVRERLVSRAKTLASVADVLSGSLSGARDWSRMVLEQVNAEVGKDGLSCSLDLRRPDQPFLPQSDGSAGTRIPIMVGEQIFGAIFVTNTHPGPLSASDHDFFSSMARSLGSAFHRAKLWEDLQARIEAAKPTPARQPVVIDHPREAIRRFKV